MVDKLKLDLPLLLPESAHERGCCVDRLLERLGDVRAIEKVHVTAPNGRPALCLHYDPNLATLASVERMAHEAGADVVRLYQHETLPIEGMRCGDCAASVEHIIGRMMGVTHVAVNYAAESMRVEYDSSTVSRAAIVRRLRRLGYDVPVERPTAWLRTHGDLVLAMAGGLLLLVGYTGGAYFGWSYPASIACYVAAYLACGYHAARHGVAAALRLRLGIDFLMIAAALGAAMLGHWVEGALLLFLFSLGHALEHYALGRARGAIKALGSMTPKVARVRRDGALVEIPIQQLAVGDVAVVRPGERIPVDGQVVDGQSAVDQSPVTGESMPVDRGAGDTVFAGTLNGEGALEVEVTRLAADTTIARVVQMVEEAQTQKSSTHRFAERFESIFVPLVLLATVLVVLLPGLAGWRTWADAVFVGLTMLVAASPCALAIATPAAVLAAVAQAARHGVLVKGGAHLERLGQLRAMALDKTGTITTGSLSVVRLLPQTGVDPNRLVQMSAAAEQHSAHPLAKAIVRHAQQSGIEPPAAHAARSVPGLGVECTVDGKSVQVGNREFFSRQDMVLPNELIDQHNDVEAAGQTGVIVTCDGRFLGIVALADRPRDNARRTVEQLRSLGVDHLLLLTGDNQAVAARVAAEVGIDEVRAGLLPQDKVAQLRLWSQRHGSTAMVGDGVNDAPAMKEAAVGIAMGACGSDVALETADVALMADDLSKLPLAVALGRQSNRIIRQNLFIALAVIALLLPCVVLRLTGMGAAVLIHEGSTLLVVANALRLLTFRHPR